MCICVCIYCTSRARVCECVCVCVNVQAKQCVSVASRCSSSELHTPTACAPPREAHPRQHCGGLQGKRDGGRGGARHTSGLPDSRPALRTEEPPPGEGANHGTPADPASSRPGGRRFTAPPPEKQSRPVESQVIAKQQSGAHHPPRPSKGSPRKRRRGGSTRS